MIVRLPENLEKSLRAEVAGGRFRSVDDAVAEAVRRLLQDPGGVPPESRPEEPADPLIGALRDDPEAAAELDEIVEDAMRRRRSETWRL